jgi:alginate O-acetyltransferase complex protein AlgI
MIGWVFFRADSLPGALAFLQAMAGFAATAPTPYAVEWYLTPDVRLAVLAGAIGSTPVMPALARWRDAAERRTPAWAIDGASLAALALVLFASILHIAGRTYNPFIYFRF